MRWLVRILVAVAMLAALGAAGYVVVQNSLQPRPLDAFYDGPFAIPPGASAGAVLRNEPLGTHGGARVFRIVFLSTNEDGSLQPISALAAIPERTAPAGGWPLIAAAHGTTGNARPCAPSRSPLNPIVPPFIPAWATGAFNTTMRPFLDAGYAVILPDYRGLGVAGAPSYLIGLIEGRNVLDSARAMRRLELPLAPQTYLWGHSQGGHSAAFAAQLATQYAPDAGVAGALLLAPATQPGPLFAALYSANQPSAVNGLAAFVVDAWSQVYTDTPANTVVSALYLPRLSIVRAECLLGVIQAFEAAVPQQMFLADPQTIPGWSGRIRENTASIVNLGIPVFLAQGLADVIVDPNVTQQYAREQCAAGNRLNLVTYPGEGHFEVATVSVPDQLRWLQATRAGQPPSTC